MRGKHRSFLIVFIFALLLAGCKKEEAQAPVYVAEGIRKLSIVNEGEELLEIAYKPEEYESSYEYWKMRVPYGEGVIVDTEAMLELYQQVEKLDFEEALQLSGEEKTGLEKSNTTIAIEFCQNNPSYEAEADSSSTLIIGGSNGAGDYYTTLETNTDKIYLMPEEVIDEILSIKPFDLILKISAAVGIDTVEEVIATIGGKEYEISETKLGTEIYHTLYAELNSVFVVKEIEEEQKIGAEVLLKLYFKRNIKSAKDLEVLYYVYDEEYASVCVNGIEKFLVRRSDVEVLKETIEAINE